MEIPHGFASFDGETVKGKFNIKVGGDKDLRDLKTYETSVGKIGDYTQALSSLLTAPGDGPLKPYFELSCNSEIFVDLVIDGIRRWSIHFDKGTGKRCKIIPRVCFHTRAPNGKRGGVKGFEMMVQARNTENGKLYAKVF